MTDIFDIDASVQEDGDRMPVKPGSFDPLNTGLYKMVIQKIYFEESSGGANCCKLELRREDNTGPIIRETLWLTSGKAKGRRNYWTDSDGVKHLMGGLEKLKQLHYVVTGKAIKDITQEKKLVKLRNWETGQDEPMERVVPVDLVGAHFVAAITKCCENKRKPDANGDYKDTNEKRTFNSLTKALSAKGGLSMTEIMAEAEEAAWAKQFREDFAEDYIEDTYQPIEGAIDLSDGDAADDDLPWGGEEAKPEAKAETESLFD